MSGLQWIHLSDWHQRGADFDRKVVRDELIKDIKAREKIDPSLEDLDFIVFSGDISFSGQDAEFQTAKTELFDPVLAAASLTSDRLFMVPGNHDLDRGVVGMRSPLRPSG
jgi:3',5'-cyclic AMP phosphodiesterase CpdA